MIYIHVYSYIHPNFLLDLLSIQITYQVNVYLCYHIYPTPPLGQVLTQGQFFKQSLIGLNSEFSFS